MIKYHSTRRTDLNNNRFSLGKSSGEKQIRKINRFFLACELKPGTRLFKTELSDFSYDIKPAFIFGKLGVISYTPNSYSLIKVSGKDIVVGYMLTITNPDAILLLDKLKSFYGRGSFNYHVRKLVHAYTDPATVETAWAYILSEQTMRYFESIEGVPNSGFWDYTDEPLFNFLDGLKKI
jgi:hypothetical protein